MIPFLTKGKQPDRVLAVLSRCLAEAVFPSSRPLSDVIMSLAQKRRGRLSGILRRISKDIKAGMSEADAFTGREKYLGSFFCRAVSRGFRSDNPSAYFSGLAVYYDAERQFRIRLVNLIKYPLIVALVSAVAIFTSLAFLVPSAHQAFAIYGELPAFPRAAARLLCDTPLFASIFPAALFLLPPCMLIIYGKFKRPDTAWHIAFLHEAFLWKLSRRATARRLSLLLSNGMEPPDSLNICSVSAARDLTGRSFMETVSVIFPQAAASDSGQRTAAPFPDVKRLNKTAEFYEEEIESAVSAAVLVSEPAAVAAAGLLGAGILAVLYLPLMR